MTKVSTFFAAAFLGLTLMGPALLAQKLWDDVVAFDPGLDQALQSPARPVQQSATPDRAAGSFTVVVVDGLRFDASRAMPFVNELRSRGADFELQVGTPSFSRPGRATIASGAWASLHAVTTNRQKRPLVLDNILRRVADAGLSCRVAGSPIWSSLFGKDIARCGVSRDERTKEGPGTFDRVVPEVRESQEAAIKFVIEAPATFRVVDILSTDFAAHEFGGASRRYKEEVGRADEWIRAIASRLDLEKDTVIVTADHGHIDLEGHGGHGGDEREVLTIPLVMAGRGVTRGVRGTANHIDIAPTLTALLNIEAPAGAEGRALCEALALTTKAQTSCAEFEKQRATRLANIDEAARQHFRLAASEAPWRSKLLSQIQTGRRVSGGVALALCALLTLATLLGNAVLRHALVAGLVIQSLTLWALFRFVAPPVSLSSINYDENVTAFFGRLLCFVLLSQLAGLFAASRFRSANGQMPEVIARLSVAAVLVSLGTFVWTWQSAGLFSPYLPQGGALANAFVFLLAASAMSALALAGLSVATIATKSRSIAS